MHTPLSSIRFVSYPPPPFTSPLITRPFTRIFHRHYCRSVVPPSCPEPLPFSNCLCESLCLLSHLPPSHIPLSRLPVTITPLSLYYITLLLSSLFFSKSSFSLHARSFPTCIILSSYSPSPLPFSSSFSLPASSLSLFALCPFFSSSLSSNILSKLFCYTFLFSSSFPFHPLFLSLVLSAFTFLHYHRSHHDSVHLSLSLSFHPFAPPFTIVPPSLPPPYCPSHPNQLALLIFASPPPPFLSAFLPL